MYVIVWTYEVRGDSKAEFEKLYGPQGAWSRLMDRHEGYRGTELFRDWDNPHRYLTVDRWDSVVDYERFRDRAAADFAALDAEGELLTLDETKIGAFETP